MGIVNGNLRSSTPKRLHEISIFFQLGHVYSQTGSGKTKKIVLILIGRAPISFGRWITSPDSNRIFYFACARFH